MCYVGPYSTYSTYSKEPGESGCSVACLVRYSTYSTYSKEPGESGCSVACLVRCSTFSTYSKGPGDCEGSAWYLPRLPPGRACPASEPCRARAKVGILPRKKNRNCRLIRQFRRTLKPPRPRHLPGIEAAPRSGFFPGKKCRGCRLSRQVNKKFPVVLWGDDCREKKSSCPVGGRLSKVSANLPGRAAPARRHGGTQLMSRITNYEAVTERRKSRSGTRGAP